MCRPYNVIDRCLQPPVPSKVLVKQHMASLPLTIERWYMVRPPVDSDKTSSITIHSSGETALIPKQSQTVAYANPFIKSETSIHSQLPPVGHVSPCGVVGGTLQDTYCGRLAIR